MSTATTTARPILFSSAMVRAILDGSKTMTRRVVKLRNFQPSTTPGYDWQFRGTYRGSPKSGVHPPDLGATMSDTRKPLTPADLPMELPEPCPVCGAKMEMFSIAYFTLRFGYFAPQIRCGAMKPAFDAGGERWESWRSAHAMVDADRLKAISDRMFNHLNDAYRWEGR